MAAGSGFPTDMLDLVDIQATEVQRGIVACALYRDGRRECDVAVEEIGALAGRDGGIIWLGLNEPDQALLDGRTPVVTAARDELERVDPFAAPQIETALRGLAERLELSPRKAFEPSDAGSESGPAHLIIVPMGAFPC